MNNDLTYIATKTASEFHHDNSFVRLMIGPVGCGKSVASCIEVLARAMSQAPGRDGIRRSRWAVIRNTYPELISTTITTWRTWYPEEKFGKIKFTSPIKQHIKFNDVDLEVYFLALDSFIDIQKLKSLELTGAYINEMQFTDEQIFKECRRRCNRYPSKKYGAPISWTGVIADANPPDTSHWIYKVFEIERPENFKLFKFDSPLTKVDKIPEEGRYSLSSTGTCYIPNKVDYVKVQTDPEYWIKLVPGSTDEEVKVNLMGEYGVIISGKPVHPTYNDTLHFANKELQYNSNIELVLGWDFGLTPAVALMQLTERGRLYIIDELWAWHMGLRDFVENIVKPHLDLKYDGWDSNFSSYHDPAGQAGSQTDEESCSDILKEFGFKSEPAASNNDATPRRDGIKYFLGKMIDGQPAFSVSNKCQMIREGLMGRFQYARVKAGGEERYFEKPLKNIHSHICEALEYGVMNLATDHRAPILGEEKAYTIHRGSFLSM